MRSASRLAISSFWMFPAEGGPRLVTPPEEDMAPPEPPEDPGAERSFTRFLELNMLSICSSI
jgi:hypothetical protein